MERDCRRQRNDAPSRHLQQFANTQTEHEPSVYPARRRCLQRIARVRLDAPLLQLLFRVVLDQVRLGDLDHVQPAEQPVASVPQTNKFLDSLPVSLALLHAFEVVKDALPLGDDELDAVALQSSKGKARRKARGSLAVCATICDVIDVNAIAALTSAKYNNEHKRSVVWEGQTVAKSNHNQTQPGKRSFVPYGGLYFKRQYEVLAS
jgi:hypothetical protein